jgi:hypothetical protein
MSLIVGICGLGHANAGHYRGSGLDSAIPDSWYPRTSLGPIDLSDHAAHTWANRFLENRLSSR